MAKNKKKFSRRLLDRYKLLIINEETFEEKASFRLNRLNTFVLSMLTVIFFVGLTAVIIAFTPLREYIPGYSTDPKLRREAITLNAKVDSLENELVTNNVYLNRIRRVLSGDIAIDDLTAIDTTMVDPIDSQELSFSAPSREDSLLRAEVEREDRYNIIEGARTKTNFVFFPPLKGKVSAVFDASEQHYAVDVIAAMGTPVKAVADGTVIYAGWSVDTGHTLIMEHSYGLITVYKHASKLSKEQGNKVQAGEVIAAVGNTGELTSGPHLHFELWSNGYPLDPVNFIEFE